MALRENAIELIKKMFEEQRQYVVQIIDGMSKLYHTEGTDSKAKALQKTESLRRGLDIHFDYLVCRDPCDQKAREILLAYKDEIEGHVAAHASSAKPPAVAITVIEPGTCGGAKTLKFTRSKKELPEYYLPGGTRIVAGNFELLKAAVICYHRFRTAVQNRAR